ncbi:hypothetical protein M9H77_32103 [Catharanthus roseus]|uniref:Uncharacterized protein n=1 Tax=Catharanthus roseus TaxID=4058 RepID=A0ACC0A5V2_CATRO|nr:hypothetical protein M9H77_32103 [Catharanthus roseus]
MHDTKSILIMITLLVLLLHNTAAEKETLFSSPPPPKSNGSAILHLKFNPSTAVIIICLISAFFLMGCVSVYIRQCAEQRLMNDLDDDAYAASRRRARRAVTRGLDPIIIDEFPMFLYSDVKGLKLGKGALECAVCLNEFEDDETLRLLPKCSHVFHPDCIDAWLACHVTCPVCRAILIPKPEEIGSCDSLSRHLFVAQPSDSLPSHSEINSSPQLNNPEIDIQITSAPEFHNIPKTPRINGKFPRSHSMGQLLIRPGEDCERFTLRLPKEVRSQLMKSELSRAKSCVAFPRVRSSRKGYMSNYNDRFGREVRSDRWGGNSVAPSLFSRGGSIRSSKNELEGGEITVASRNLFKSVKCPFDRLFGGAERDNDGERSFNRLRDETPV